MKEFEVPGQIQTHSGEGIDFKAMILTTQPRTTPLPPIGLEMIQYLSNKC